MSYQAFRLTKALKDHDDALLARKGDDGKIHVYRKGQQSLHHIFSLTEDWTTHSRAVEWGVEPIIQRLKAIDTWNHDVAGRVIDEELKADRGKEADRRNTYESFLLDIRKQFAKATNDINTGTLNKSDKRRH